MNSLAGLFILEDSFIKKIGFYQIYFTESKTDILFYTAGQICNLFTNHSLKNNIKKKSR